MKRYRIFRYDYDTRCEILKFYSETPEDKLNQDNYNKVIAGLKMEFGELHFEHKKQNLMDIGSKSFSVVAYHNSFINQIRTAFIMGAYYPALTAACALGERILNHLILNLRDEFKYTDEYKKVCRKESFDNWSLAIETLASWKILLPEAEKKYKKLYQLRNQSIHFNLKTETNIRDEALQAVLLIQGIIENQFSGWGPHPWFLTDIDGEIYIKKEWEQNPYIKLIYIPNSALVGFHHKVVSISPWTINDNFAYEECEITDTQFTELRKSVYMN